MQSSGLTEPLLLIDQPGSMTAPMLPPAHTNLLSPAPAEPNSPLFDSAGTTITGSLSPQTSSSSDASSHSSTGSSHNGSPPTHAPIHYSASSHLTIHQPNPAAFLSPPVHYSTLSHSNSSSSSLSAQRHRSGSHAAPPAHTRYPSSSFTFKGFHRKHTPITLQFNKVSLTLSSGQQILSDVTGHFPHSRLIAIMGPSGAGKTSFLNVLAGRSAYARMAGTISINHIPCSTTRLRSYAGFVPQDDILHPDLTVYENLYYSAMLRLPRRMKKTQKIRIIEDTIEMLGLDHIRNSRVGSVEKRGISGGQRKRVNIGTELVANPSLLFMDEPTSGLDASAALEVLSSLRRLADLGLTIITVVHQPRYSIFSSFHTVLLLGQGGRTVYLGRTEECMAYFDSLGFEQPENENPADFIMDVISGVVRDRKDRGQLLSDELTTLANTTTNAERAEGQPLPEEEEEKQNPLLLSSTTTLKKKTLSFAPTLTHTTSAIAELPMLAASALTRTLSASQGLREVASLIIDMPPESNADRKEPVMDFAEAWNDHRLKAEEEKRLRRGSNASNGGYGNKRRSNSSASSTLESPEQRNRSLSDASVESTTSMDSARSGSSERSALGSRVYAIFSKAERERQEKEKINQLFDQFANNYMDDGEEWAAGAGSPAGELSTGGSVIGEVEEKSWRGKYCANPQPLLSSSRKVQSGFNAGMVVEEEDEETSTSCFSRLFKPKPLEITLDASHSSSSPKAAHHSTNHSPASSSAAEDDYHSLASLPHDHVFGLPTLHAPPTFTTQFLLLTHRLTLKLFRNWTYSIVDMALCLFLAVVVGWVYGSDWSLGEYTSQSVFSSLCMGVCAAVASLRLFGADRLIYWRESLVGVNETSYFFSLILVELHRAFAYPLVFVSAYLPLAKPQAAFHTIYFVFCATYFAMAGLGLLLSVICRPVPALMIATMLPLVIGGFLAGVNPPVNQMSSLMAFVSNFSFTRWAVEPLGMAEGKFVNIYGADNVYWWLDHFKFVDRYWVDIGALMAMGCGFRILAAFALRRFSRTYKG